ncbi:MFS transporter [Salinarimonas rosea]|uniref:MFS transporter n=1 Tax=Salinarimonas rosea TaxID=552063 RepID=UPI0004125D20|nr:MFS transporter [Salinarimonas rosea]
MSRERIARYLYVGQGVSSLGDGVWFAIWAIYLTEIVAIAPSTLGIVVAACGIVGILLAYPLGVAADRFSPRDILVLVTLVRGAAMIGFSLIEGVVGLAFAALGFFGTQSAATGVRTALVCALFDTERQLDVLARTRVVQHVGYAAGAGIGALVLAASDPWAFRAALLGNAVSFAVLAGLTAVLPRARGETTEPGSDAAVLEDVPYAALMALTAVMALSWALMSTALPLWTRNHTEAPVWLAALLFGLTALLTVAFQVPVVRRVGTVARGARAGVLAGVLLAGGCLLFLASGRVGAGPAAMLLIVGTLVVVGGELYFVGSRWALSLGLINPRLKGRYQGVAASMEAMITAVGPAVMTMVVTASGIGWILLAALFLAAGLGTPLLTRWAQAQRSFAPETRAPAAARAPRTP